MHHTTRMSEPIVVLPDTDSSLLRRFRRWLSHHDTTTAAVWAGSVVLGAVWWLANRPVPVVKLNDAVSALVMVLAAAMASTGVALVTLRSCLEEQGGLTRGAVDRAQTHVLGQVNAGLRELGARQAAEAAELRGLLGRALAEQRRLARQVAALREDLDEVAAQQRWLTRRVGAMAEGLHIIAQAGQEQEGATVRPFPPRRPS